MKGCFRVVLAAVALLIFIFVISAIMPDEPLSPFEQACKDRGGEPHHRLISISKQRLKYPDTFERHAPFGQSSNGRFPPLADGRFRAWQRFMAKNASGMKTRHLASDMVNESDCSLDISTLKIVEFR